MFLGSVGIIFEKVTLRKSISILAINAKNLRKHIRLQL